MDIPAVIARDVRVETVVRKSRFLATLTRVGTLEQAEETIARVRKEHWRATHNCTALVVGPHAAVQRSSDDGEPAGTAGTPMLEVLRRREVTDVVAVVTRYFGGILLGAGGLVRAYSQAVTDALDTAGLLRREPRAALRLECSAAQVGRWEYELRSRLGPGAEVRTDYGQAAVLRFAVPEADLPDIEAWAARGPGHRALHHEGTTWVEVPQAPGPRS